MPSGVKPRRQSAPEQGEEAFPCHLRGRPSRGRDRGLLPPADLPTRLAGPLARQIQKATTKRYIDGIRAYVQGK
jgi:hypothetical protein